VPNAAALTTTFCSWVWHVAALAVPVNMVAGRRRWCSPCSAAGVGAVVPVVP
jgi:hypothetical protein